MDRVVNKKTVLKNCNSGGTEKKQKKEKCACSPIMRKGKNVRKSIAKVKKVIRNENILNQWAENESSKPELYERPRILRNIKYVGSDESVIYVGKYSENQLHNALPVIDLTQSPSQSIHKNLNLLRSKTLQTIYFPSRNFDRNIKLRKSMATTSLITLPVQHKHKLPKKVNSTTILSCSDREKLDILDIPQESLNFPDVSMDGKSFLEKSKLTREDYKIIEWILDVENDDNATLSPSTSGYDSSLGADLSRERVCIIDSKLRIDQCT